MPAKVMKKVVDRLVGKLANNVVKKVMGKAVSETPSWNDSRYQLLGTPRRTGFIHIFEFDAALACRFATPEMWCML